MHLCIISSFIHKWKYVRWFLQFHIELFIFKSLQKTKLQEESDVYFRIHARIVKLPKHISHFQWKPTTYQRRSQISVSWRSILVYVHRVS